MRTLYSCFRRRFGCGFGFGRLRVVAPVINFCQECAFESCGGGRGCLLELANVSHVYAEDKLTYAVAGGEAFVIDHAIRELEARLDPQRFVRIHRATLVNLDHVAELYFGAGGVWVRLSGSPPAELPVARDRVAALRERLRLPERPLPNPQRSQRRRSNTTLSKRSAQPV